MVKRKNLKREQKSYLLRTLPGLGRCHAVHHHWIDTAVRMPVHNSILYPRIHLSSSAMSQKVQAPCCDCWLDLYSVIWLAGTVIYLYLVDPLFALFVPSPHIASIPFPWSRSGRSHSPTGLSSCKTSIARMTPDSPTTTSPVKARAKHRVPSTEVILI